MLRLAWLSGNGAAHAAQMLGLARWPSHWLPLARGASAGLRVAALGGAVAALALTLTGHSRIHPQRGLFALLLSAHLLLVAFWFGALWPLLRVLRDESMRVAANIVARFSAARRQTGAADPACRARHGMVADP